MGIFGSDKNKKKDGSGETSENSIIISNARIDRAGNEWKRKSVWFRQEHLGKLKVMAHFRNTRVEALLNQALEEFLKKNYDNSMAMKEMVEKSTGKIPIVKV